MSCECGKITFSIAGYEMVKKTASPEPRASRVYLRKSWAGKKIAVVLLEAES